MSRIHWRQWQNGHVESVSISWHNHTFSNMMLAWWAWWGWNWEHRGPMQPVKQGMIFNYDIMTWNIFYMSSPLWREPTSNLFHEVLVMCRFDISLIFGLNKLQNKHLCCCRFVFHDAHLMAKSLHYLVRHGIKLVSITMVETWSLVWLSLKIKCLIRMWYCIQFSNGKSRA